MFDIAIIGAGISGLTCAQQLHQAGYNVVVVDKSRGVGGRAATRRVQNIRVDHGLRFLEPMGEMSAKLIEVLRSRHLLQLWYESSSQSRYVVTEGMSAIAKFLAADLELQLNCRVEKIALNQDNWQLTIESTDTQILAKAVVFAIPAPQALTILLSLSSYLPASFINSLQQVEFDPCLTVLAGYSSSQAFEIAWKDRFFPPNSDPEKIRFKATPFISEDNPKSKIQNLKSNGLAWIGLDSSKRNNAQAPVFVLHSSAKFAAENFETPDLNAIGKHLLSCAATELAIPELDLPQWYQVHRWRYAFPSHAFADTCLDAKTPQPLICCGDWCGGNLVESALISGRTTAEKINQSLRNLSLPGSEFLERL